MEINKILKWAIIIVILIPIIVYFFIVFKFSENIPYWDDYDAVLAFLTYYLEQDLQGKLGLLFQPHNEHRIFVSRVITVTDYFLFGKVNLEHLIYIGNLFLLGIFFLLYKAFKVEIKSNLWLFIPVPMILFQAQYLTNSVWAMASIQNFGVIFFSLLSLYLLNRQRLATSLFTGALAVLTSGGGFLVFPIGALYIWMNWKLDKRFYIWCITGVVIIGLYFYGYKSNPDHPSIWYSFNNPMSGLEYLANFTGSYFKIWGRHIAWIFALVFFTFVGFIILKKEYKEMPLIAYFLLFLVLTAGLTTLSRAGFGHDQAWTDRYRMYSALFVALAYLAGLKLLPNNRPNQILFGVVLAISIMNNTYCYTKYYPQYEDHQTRLRFSDELPYYPGFETARKILLRSEKADVYKLDYDYYQYKSDMSIQLPEPTDNIAFDFEIKDLSNHYYIENGWTFLKSTTDVTKDSVYIVLSTANKNHIYRTFKLYRPDVSRHFKKELDRAGFRCLIPKNTIKSEKYDIGILVVSEGKSYYQLTNKTIENNQF